MQGLTDIAAPEATTTFGSSSTTLTSASDAVRDQRLTLTQPAFTVTELLNPQVALAATVHNMMLTALHEDFVEGLTLAISLRLQGRLKVHAPDLLQSPAAAAMNEQLYGGIMLLVSSGGYPEI